MNIDQVTAETIQKIHISSCKLNLDSTAKGWVPLVKPVWNS